jgi:hypothetical protein
MTPAQRIAARHERIDNAIADADAPKRRFSLDDLLAMPDEQRLELLPGALIVIGAFYAELIERQMEAKGAVTQQTA